MMKKVKRMLATIAVALSVSVTPAKAANKIADSALGKGLSNLIQDVTLFTGIAGVSIGGAAAAIFLTIRSFADKDDAPMWTKRAKTAGVCAVLIPLVSAIIALFSSYFS